MLRGLPLALVATSVALIAVAAALSVGALLGRGPGGPARPAATSAGALPPGSGGVDWAALRYPVACPSGSRLSVVNTDAAVDRAGDGIGVAAVRCDTGAGAPPVQVYGVTVRHGVPRIDQVLVSTRADRLFRSAQVGRDAVTLRLYGYGEPGVPRCCPDLAVTETFAVHEGRWQLLRSSAAAVPTLA